MATATTNKDPKVSLSEKMLAEIEGGHPYEALQLAESYIARKKKTLGRQGTSELVFHAAKVLVQGKAPADAGTLVAWYMTDGAGDDYYFRLKDDLLLVVDLFHNLSDASSHALLQTVYGAFHKLLLKADVVKTLSAEQHNAIKQLETQWIEAFVSQRDWHIAVKALIRVNNMSRVAQLLDAWARSDNGYINEYALFFSRTILQLLADSHSPRALELYQASKPFVQPFDDEAAAIDTNTGNNSSIHAPALAIWHFTSILVELQTMENKPRVDKNKIFFVLCEKYENTFKKVDMKLIPLINRIGQNYFGVETEEQVNPMAAMFQSMLKAPANNTSLPKLSNNNNSSSNGKKARKDNGPVGINPNLDMETMLRMLSKLK